MGFREPGGMVSGEAVLIPFLESAECLSIEELSTNVDRGFLGGGELAGEDLANAQTVLRLRLRPADGGEFSLIFLDYGSEGVELRFFGLPALLAPYVREVWAFQNQVGPCPEGAPYGESVRFGGWLAMEVRCKLNDLSLSELRVPQPAALFGEDAPFFETGLEFQSTNRTNRVCFSSTEVRLDPMSRHFEVIEWVVALADRVLHTALPRERLRSFEQMFLAPNRCEAWAPLG